ncbi:hypothetical protein TPHA_0B04230 [Tetrapisispora phaffii CBS 4417]|uniref:Large ribosomal subunit protein mL46 n=1 Tax=Tetrapisispora phaffii (strain ATCC 24235 / CBS 4417 / NBRC 1672 / NRRL Y-8282 / UCD 70-5) TaxID=1071381 RepID=G8BQ12_TETPH|nr:mitochondrial 54S ribosomal protein YmL17/YmL30 TPHA_0B04230 [Tetrapisispora phaffii CBS 4417]CCE62093.1 hypothetical protein TPHA_0B04230 [Tetrapisispora phaffii CBS 4417]
MLSIRRSLATSSEKAVSSSLRAGIILSRNPIVTPDVTNFEQNYYTYQALLERRLMWTFPHYYYFKRGTLSQSKFSSAQPGPISKLPGVWFPKGVPDVKHNRERRLKQEVVLPKSKGDVQEGNGKSDDLTRSIEPNSRITEADKTNDITSLERKLSRTLYLLVQNKNKIWTFPNFDATNTGLHKDAEEGLRSLGGEKMYTWTVSKKPLGFIENKDGSKEFLIKSHILAGSFQLLKKNEHNISNFAWLTKEEIKEKVSQSYYNYTEFMLADN